MRSPIRSPIRSPNRRQRLQSALTGATGLGLFGCSAWTRPRVITLREAELVDRLARLFPLTDQVLEVLEDLVIYRLGAEPQAGLREAGLAAGAVTVAARGVEITLQRVAG